MPTFFAEDSIVRKCSKASISPWSNKQCHLQNQDQAIVDLDVSVALL